MYILVAAAQAPQASWWQLAPYLLLGTVAIVVGALSSRKGPRS